MLSSNWRNEAGFLICGAAAFAVWLICLLPAPLIDRYLKTKTDGIVRISEARGTVWAGEGYLEFRDNEKPAAPPQHITWRFLPDSMWNGSLGFTLTLNQSAETSLFSIGISSVTLRNAAFQLPAATLGVTIPKLAPLGLQGDLSIVISDMQFDGKQKAGNGRLEWKHAGSAMTTVSPLGHYRADLVTRGPVINVTLRTLNGPLQLAGQGAWAFQSAPNFAGTASVPASLQQQLSPMLRLIAAERIPGEFDIQIR
jgi:general secretion pathway protein N